MDKLVNERVYRVRILKTILLLFGVFLLFWGHDIFSSKFNELFTGLFTGFLFLVAGYIVKNENHKKNDVIFWVFLGILFIVYSLLKFYRVV